MVNLGTAVGYLILDATNFNNTLDTAFNKISMLDNEARNNLTGGLDVISTGLKTTGKVLTASITAPVTAFGASAIKSGAEFDSAMARVKAIAGDFGEQQEDSVSRLQEAAEKNKLVYKDMGSYIDTAFELVRQKAIQMGNDTKFTAEESADALYYMALAGWGGADMLEGLDGIMALSAASGVELARTSDIVTDALTAFGKEASEASRFADILAATSANSNTNVDLLGESFKYVAPVAGAYGYELKDVALALGTMASAGVKGTQAGTGLRQALKQLTTPTDENAALMEKYGISLDDGTGKMLTLRESMEQWRETFGGINVELYDTEGNLKTGEQIMEEYGHSLPTTEMEKLNAIASIFGTRALPGVLAIINSSDDKFKELAADIDGSSESFGGMGDAAYQQAVMLDNLKGDWVLFTSALNTAKITILDMISGPLRGFVKWLRDLVTGFNKASPETQKFIIRMALIAASIGPVIFALGSMVGAVSKVIKNVEKIKSAAGLMKSFFGLFGKGAGALTGPIGAIIAIIVVLIAMIVRLWKTNEKFRNNIKAIWDKVSAQFAKTFDKIGKYINKFKEAFKPLIDIFMDVFDAVSNVLAPVFEYLFDFIGSSLATAFDAVVEVFGIFVSLLNGDLPGALESAKTLLDDLGQLMINFFTYVPGLIYTFVESLLNAFGTSIPEVFETVKLAFTTFIDVIVQFCSIIFESIKTAVLNAFTNVLNFVKKTAKSIADWFVNIINKANAWRKLFITLGKTAALNFFEKVKEFISYLPGKVKEWLDNVIQKVLSWASRFKEEARKAAVTFRNNIKENLTELSSIAKEKLDNVINRAKNFAEDFAKKATEAGKDFFDNLVAEVSKIPDEVYKIGANIVEGIWNGINSMAGWLARKVSGFITDAIGAMKNAAEVESPSKLTEREIGKWLPPGIANGFEKALPDTMRRINDSLTSSILGLNDNLAQIVIGTEFVDPSVMTNGTGLQVVSTLYWMLAQYIAEALRQAPIVNNFEVDMEDGDIFLDNERVGRKVAPVVSRVLAMGGANG